MADVSIFAELAVKGKSKELKRVRKVFGTSTVEKSMKEGKPKWDAPKMRKNRLVEGKSTSGQKHYGDFRRWHPTTEDMALVKLHYTIKMPSGDDAKYLWLRGVQPHARKKHEKKDRVFSSRMQNSITPEFFKSHKKEYEGVFVLHADDVPTERDLNYDDADGVDESEAKEYDPTKTVPLLVPSNLKFAKGGKSKIAWSEPANAMDSHKGYTHHGQYHVSTRKDGTSSLYYHHKGSDGKYSEPAQLLGGNHKSVKHAKTAADMHSAGSGKGVPMVGKKSLLFFDLSKARTKKLKIVGTSGKTASMFSGAPRPTKAGAVTPQTKTKKPKLTVVQGGKGTAAKPLRTSGKANAAAAGAAKAASTAKVGAKAKPVTSRKVKVIVKPPPISDAARASQAQAKEEIASKLKPGKAAPMTAAHETTTPKPMEVRGGAGEAPQGFKKVAPTSPGVGQKMGHAAPGGGGAAGYTGHKTTDPAPTFHPGKQLKEKVGAVGRVVEGVKRGVAKYADQKIGKLEARAQGVVSKIKHSTLGRQFAGGYQSSLILVPGADGVLRKSVLTSKTRNKLSESEFALPGRRYPTHDEKHARNALARVAQHGTPEEKAKVRAHVSRKYPNIKVGGSEMEKGMEEKIHWNDMGGHEHGGYHVWEGSAKREDTRFAGGKASHGAHYKIRQEGKEFHLSHRTPLAKQHGSIKRAGLYRVGQSKHVGKFGTLEAAQSAAHRHRFSGAGVKTLAAHNKSEEQEPLSVLLCADDDGILKGVKKYRKPQSRIQGGVSKYTEKKGKKGAVRALRVLFSGRSGGEDIHQGGKVVKSTDSFIAEQIAANGMMTANDPIHGRNLIHALEEDGGATLNLRKSTWEFRGEKMVDPSAMNKQETITYLKSFLDDCAKECFNDVFYSSRDAQKSMNGVDDSKAYANPTPPGGPLSIAGEIYKEAEEKVQVARQPVVVRLKTVAEHVFKNLVKTAAKNPILLKGMRSANMTPERVQAYLRTLPKSAWPTTAGYPGTPVKLVK